MKQLYLVHAQNVILLSIVKNLNKHKKARKIQSVKMLRSGLTNNVSKPEKNTKWQEINI